MAEGRASVLSGPVLIKVLVGGSKSSAILSLLQFFSM